MLSAIRNTFKVYERLKREQHINTLFRNGKAFSVFPLRVVYIAVPRPKETDSPVMAGFSVPKKKFRSSVHRHRIRRLMVESWRLAKSEVYAHIPPHMQLHLFIIFTDNNMPVYETVNKAVSAGIAKLCAIAPTLSFPDKPTDPPLHE